MEICQGLPDGAPLVLNADDDLLPTAQIPGRLRPVWFGIRSSSADVRAINIHTVGEVPALPWWITWTVKPMSSV